MKHSLVLILSLIITHRAYSQKDSVRGERFQLTGKIKNNVHMTPHCGFIAWGTVIEFEIISISGMTYPNGSIGIIVTCPEFYEKDFFVVGKTYEAIFSNKNQADFGWTIPHEDLLKKNGLTYDPYITSIKKTL